MPLRHITPCSFMLTRLRCMSRALGTSRYVMSRYIVYIMIVTLPRMALRTLRYIALHACTARDSASHWKRLWTTLKGLGVAGRIHFWKTLKKNLHPRITPKTVGKKCCVRSSRPTSAFPGVRWAGAVPSTPKTPEELKHLARLRRGDANCHRGAEDAAERADWTLPKLFHKRKQPQPSALGWLLKFTCRERTARKIMEREIRGRWNIERGLWHWSEKRNLEQRGDEAKH